MCLYKTKRWPPMELGVFKLACLAVGMLLGSYLSGFVQQYLWVFVAVAVLASVRVCVFYCGNKEGA